MHRHEGERDEGELAEEARCLNCGEVLRGAYCHACGQKGGGARLHFHELVHEIVHEFLHFDSKILRTLRLLLFSPGTLTREYVAGRRVRYVGPVRLFLVASVVLFGLLAFVKTEVAGEANLAAADAEIALNEEKEALKGDRFGVAITRAARKVIREPEYVKEAVLKTLSKSFFLLLPIFAWVTWRLFAREQPFYVAHMYFALHFHAFAFMLLGWVTALTLARVPSNGFLHAGAGIVIIVYFYAALQRVLELSWARALVRGSIVLLICSAFNVVVIGAFLAVTMLML